MDTNQTMFPAISRVEGLERLDLLDWDEIHDAVQAILQSLDAEVKRAAPEVCVKSDRNAVRERDLFSYRVYQPGPDSKVDPVVVGVVCALGENGFVVRGDISGETIGDVLFEVPEKEVVGRLAFLEAARNASERLAGQASTVASALQQAQRATD